MSFEADKKRYLQELQKQEQNIKDKSKKGFLDTEVKELVFLINQKNYLYTTSSCAGRIILFQAITSKKCDNEWIVVSHKEVDVKQVILSFKKYLEENKAKENFAKLQNSPHQAIRTIGNLHKDYNKHNFAKFSKGIIWLRYEPLILHVCAKTIEDAEQFLNIARSVGFKRGGITSAKKRIMIEVNGVDRLDAPIGEYSKFWVNDKYLLFLLDEANKKLLDNLERIERFTILLDKI
ncbi:hypothetical protein HZA96_06950 [Candidatus Woesearchaeota archaeon]|nr:hypothetical protein [Candidatus Woesearchaeota archaeon]